MADKSGIDEITASYYRKYASTYFESTFFADLSQIYGRFISYLPVKGEILDLGCGSGRDIKFFMERGFKVIGLEKSPELAKLASEATGIKVIVSDMRDMNFKNQFIGIWACASLLHLELKNVVDVLLKCRKALCRDGVMYMSFKYGNFSGIEDGRYFTYLNEEKLAYLKEKIPELELQEVWKSKDISCRDGIYWLNLIVKFKK